MALHPYSAYLADLPNEGACLVFAHGPGQAAELGRQVIDQFFTEVGPEDVAVNALEAADHLWDQGDPKQLADGQAHVIDSPRTCRGCELWGRPIGEDGYCTVCQGEEDPSHG